MQQITRDSRRADYREGQGARSAAFFIERRRRVSGHDADVLERFADAEQQQSDDIELLVAETFIEAAIDHEDQEAALRCIGKAQQRLQKVSKKAERSSYVSLDTLRAEVLSTYMPFFGILAVEGSLPDATHLDRTYERAAHLASHIGNNWDYLQERHRGRLVGFSAEFLGLTLLQRFATHTMGDGTWWPSPSTVTNGRLGKERGARGCTNWDIDVRTSLCADRRDSEVSYRVEVKSNEAAVGHALAKHGHYADNIALVNLRSDVLSDMNHGQDLSIAKALRIIGLEQVTGRNGASDVIDAIQDRMVEAIE